MFSLSKTLQYLYTGKLPKPFQNFDSYRRKGYAEDFTALGSYRASMCTSFVLCVILGQYHKYDNQHSLKGAQGTSVVY